MTAELIRGALILAIAVWLGVLLLKRGTADVAPENVYKHPTRINKF